MRSLLRRSTLAFLVAFVGPSLRPAGAGDVPPVVGISATLTRTSGRVGQLSVTADIANGFHIYAPSQPRPFLATRIIVAESPAVRVTGAFTASRPPRIVAHPTLGVEVHEYEGRVTWTAPVEFSSAPDAELVAQGTVFAQACQEDRCLAPKTYEFKAPLRIDPVPSPGRSGQAAAVAETDATRSIAVAPPAPLDGGAGMGARLPADEGSSGERFSLDRVEVAATASGPDSVWAILPLAFVAGFLLNLMPCVLPVVGLKLLSFVQQSGDSRRRVLLLNVAYSAGLMSVMLVLATLAVFAGLGWGEQFSSTTFSVILAAIVFAFGLSFLGIWEIPAPGYVGTAGGPARGEGYGGAFIKGVLSTLLATPCSGPFLGSALAWAIVQPAYLTYVVFAFVALGMASPYLLVGLFPRLVRLLPRPGNWMVTFKQIMGFVLLATVVYLLSFIPAPSVVPTVLVLLGVGFGCWWVGRSPWPESRGRRLRAWGVAAASVAATAWLSFGWLEGVMAERFRTRRGTRAPRRGRSFGSGGGAPPSGCRRHRLGAVLETQARGARQRGQDRVRRFHGRLVPDLQGERSGRHRTTRGRPADSRERRRRARADKTRPAPEVDETLRHLGNKAASIPFYAIFPGDPSRKPILLDGLLTSPGPVVEAVRQAGPSRGARILHMARTGRLERRVGASGSTMIAR